MAHNQITDYAHVIIPENAASIAQGLGNILEQSAINQSNTIYHIVYDFDINAATIVVPSNCILLFDSGSLTNGTIQGTNTGVQAPGACIFNGDILLTGTWDNLIIQPQWFGAVGDGITDDTDAFEDMAICCSSLSGAVVWLPRGHYIISHGLVFTNDITMYGDGPKSILDFENVQGGNLKPHNCLLFTKETLTYSGSRVSGIQTELVTTLAANAARMDTEILLVDNSSIASNDIILLQNRNLYSYSTQRDCYQQGEIHRVTSSDYLGNVMLYGRLYASYNMADTDVYKLKPICVNLSHFALRLNDYYTLPDDPQERASDTHPKGSTGILVVSGYQCNIHHIIAQGTDNSHITLSNCYLCELSHISVEYCSVACGYNYGIHISQSQSIGISNCYLRTTRHGLTTGGGGPFGIHIVNREISITDSVISTFAEDKNGDRNVIEGMNTHGNTECIGIQRCLLDGGVSLVGDDMVISNCIITNEKNECAGINIGHSHGHGISFINNVIHMAKRLPEQGYDSYRFINLNVQEIDPQSHGYITFKDNRITLADNLRDSNSIIAWINGLADDNEQNFVPKLKVQFWRNVFNCNLEGVNIMNKYIRLVGYLKDVIFQDNVMDCGIDTYSGTQKLDSLIATGNTWRNAPYAVRLNIAANNTYDNVLINDNVFFGEARYPIAVHKGGSVTIQNNILRVGDTVMNTISSEQQIIKMSGCTSVTVTDNVIRYDGIENNRKWFDVVDDPLHPTTVSISDNTIVPSTMPPVQP